MLKEFLDRVLEIHRPGQIETAEINGQIFTRVKAERVRKPEEHSPDTVRFHSLSGIVQFAQCEIAADAVFFIEDHRTVHLMSCLQPNNNNERHFYAKSGLIYEPFRFGQWMDLETFVIALQAGFVMDEQAADILHMLSVLHNETVQEAKDDGFTQSLSIRTGLTTKENKKVVNPVTLSPYRTFTEVEQPEGRFIVRFKNDNGLKAVLFEAGDGRWKLAAMESIRGFLEINSRQRVIA